MILDSMSRSSVIFRPASFFLKTAAVAFILAANAFAGPIFNVGDLVVSVEGNGIEGAASGPYTDNQAAPLSLFQFAPNAATPTSAAATYVNSVVLPQLSSGTNFVVSGEYGSSSEGTLQLSGNGQQLTIMGYGVNAAAFNANPGSYGPDSTNKALGQSGSVQGQGYIAVPRVVALIDANGNIDSSTAVYNVFNTNNPRSAYTQDGKTIYISGQGMSGTDNSGGVFVTTLGGTSATPITGNDAGGLTSQDTRDVQIYNNTLYVSADSKGGSTNRDFIGTLGTAGTPPTTTTGAPTALKGFGNSGGTGKVTLTATTANGVNSAGEEINLSPENYFFASPSVLYVTDSGAPKNTSSQNDSNGSPLGDGGLQKWINSKSDGTGTWSLEYTLAAGLGLVPNSNPDIVDGDDTTGLYGLTGEVIGNQVELFATNFTIGDTDHDLPLRHHRHALRHHPEQARCSQSSRPLPPIRTSKASPSLPRRPRPNRPHSPSRASESRC